MQLNDAILLDCQRRTRSVKAMPSLIWEQQLRNSAQSITAHLNVKKFMTGMTAQLEGLAMGRNTANSRTATYQEQRAHPCANLINHLMQHQVGELIDVVQALLPAVPQLQRKKDPEGSMSKTREQAKRRLGEPPVADSAPTLTRLLMDVRSSVENATDVLFTTIWMATGGTSSDTAPRPPAPTVRLRT